MLTLLLCKDGTRTAIDASNLDALSQEGLVIRLLFKQTNEMRQFTCSNHEEAEAIFNQIWEAMNTSAGYFYQ